MLQRVSSASGPLIVAGTERVCCRILSPGVCSMCQAVLPHVVLACTGYAIMLAYVMFALLRWRSAESQAIVGLVGVLAVGLSTLAAFGLTSLLGVAFNASSTQVGVLLWYGCGCASSPSLTFPTNTRCFHSWRWVLALMMPLVCDAHLPPTPSQHATISLCCACYGCQCLHTRCRMCDWHSCVCPRSAAWAFLASWPARWRAQGPASP